jgi:hypothetical protein
MNKLLHITSVVYLALIILVKMMAMPISLMEYSLNKTFIAENLCENRTKSEMHCAGKCYLCKKLAKSNDSQDTQNQKGVSKITNVDYCESFHKLNFKLSDLDLQHNTFIRSSGIPDRRAKVIFHPPIA